MMADPSATPIEATTRPDAGGREAGARAGEVAVARDRGRARQR